MQTVVGGDERRRPIQQLARGSAKCPGGHDRCRPGFQRPRSGRRGPAPGRRNRWPGAASPRKAALRWSESTRCVAPLGEQGQDQTGKAGPGAQIGDRTVACGEQRNRAGRNPGNAAARDRQGRLGDQVDRLLPFPRAGRHRSRGPNNVSRETLTPRDPQFRRELLGPWMRPCALAASGVSGGA